MMTRKLRMMMQLVWMRMRIEDSSVMNIYCLFFGVVLLCTLEYTFDRVRVTYIMYFRLGLEGPRIFLVFEPGTKYTYVIN